MVAAYPGTLLERKARGFALHYRNRPEAGPVFHDALSALLADSTAFQLLPAHMLWEVRPLGADKGRAVAELMKREPFAGRVPVFIGDDVTDEDGMRVARAMGGAGLRVDRSFGDPEGVRHWLRAVAEQAGWPERPGSSA
jgi:trehalose 6-phosphate phosphatase